jgi:alpha-galactosidase
MVIDDGWQVAHCDNRYNAGPWHTGNRRFPDMARLASEMRQQGVRPGIWIRPLVSLEGAMERYRIRNGNRPKYAAGGYALDPTFAEVRHRLKEDASRIAGWGFEMIKHDFTTVDLLGSWLNMLDPVVNPSSGWSFHDRSRTNAEIVQQLYRDLMEGGTEQCRILGCQTVGHLGIGTIDVQRVGGDVSGREWEMTRHMGPNSLAFRAHQHGIYFQVDADCAPITPLVPFSYTQQWLQLLASSGTPLFVSVDPKAVTPETSAAVAQALKVAESGPALAQPVDWMSSHTPRVWLCGDQRRSFSWTPEIAHGPSGLNPGDPVSLLNQSH